MADHSTLHGIGALFSILPEGQTKRRYDAERKVTPESMRQRHGKSEVESRAETLDLNRSAAALAHGAADAAQNQAADHRAASTDALRDEGERGRLGSLGRDPGE